MFEWFCGFLRRITGADRRDTRARERSQECDEIMQRFQSFASQLNDLEAQKLHQHRGLGQAVMDNRRLASEHAKQARTHLDLAIRSLTAYERCGRRRDRRAALDYYILAKGYRHYLSVL